MLDTLSVQYALLVSEHLSIRGAAAQLNLQPSAVSRRLSALEGKIGVTLFERRNSGAQPTFAGRRFLDRARWALAELDHAARSATSMQKGGVGALGMAFYPSLASGLLHQILAARSGERNSSSHAATQTKPSAPEITKDAPQPTQQRHHGQQGKDDGAPVRLARPRSHGALMRCFYFPRNALCGLDGCQVGIGAGSTAAKLVSTTMNSGSGLSSRSGSEARSAPVRMRLTEKPKARPIISKSGLAKLVPGDLTGAGQGHAAAVPVQQLGSQLRFQLLDLPAEGRLGDAEPDRGPGTDCLRRQPP